MAQDQSSKNAILDAAEILFADHGFPATTIKHVARTASVNTALLYYYFDDKEALYAAVVERLVERLVAMGSAALASDDDPERAVRAVIAGQGALLASAPSWIKILARELLDAPHSRVGEPARRIASSIFAQLCATIRRGQARGQFRTDLDPRFAAISIVAQQAYFYLAQPAVRVMLDSEKVPLNDATRAAFASHVAEFCIAALKPPHGDSDEPEAAA